MKRFNKVTETYPELNREELLEKTRTSWIKYLNCGLEPPKGYRLTEAQYVQNMWLAIHQPEFIEHIKEMTTSFVEQVDKEKKGHFTHEQYLRMSGKLIGEKAIRAACQAMDPTNRGYITQEDMVKANHFFFTDTEGGHHPFNFLRGPLVED